MGIWKSFSTEAMLLKLFTETLKSESDVRAIESQWGELACNSPFMHPMWCLPWWECFRTSGMQLRVMVVRDSEGQVQGLAPFYLQTSPLMGRELRFLGDGLICSEYLSVLSRPGCEMDVVAALAESLHQQGLDERHGSWDLLDLDCYDSGDPYMRALKDYLQQQGHACQVDEVMGCWRIDFS